MESDPTRHDEDSLLQVVLGTVNAAVSSLSEAAAEQERRLPDAAAHVRELGQQLAGVTLDAVGTWPRATN
jgi:hypothetical protein